MSVSGCERIDISISSTASLQFRWLAQPRLHGLFVGEVLVFLLFKGELTKHANHRTRQEAVVAAEVFIEGAYAGGRLA